MVFNYFKDNIEEFNSYIIVYETSLVIFFISILGLILNRRSMIIFMVCLELTFLSICINFVSTSLKLSNPTGEIIALIIITTAAAEAAIGLGLLVLIHRFKKNIRFAVLNNLRG